jgi:hypothetical protein
MKKRRRTHNEVLIARMETRVKMAHDHVLQCERDLNAIRARAGLAPVPSVFAPQLPPAPGDVIDLGKVRARRESEKLWAP